jgi:hypothetical protein
MVSMPPLEVRNVELFGGGVEVVVGEDEAHHHAGNFQHVLEARDDGGSRINGDFVRGPAIGPLLSAQHREG